MKSRWYLVPLVQVAFVLGFLLAPHGGGATPGATPLRLADSPVSAGEWSIGTVRALPVLHGPSVAARRQARPASPAARAPARAPRRAAAAPPPAPTRSTAAPPAPAATPAPATSAPSSPPPAAPRPVATAPPAKPKPAPAPAPASEGTGTTFDSTGPSTFDTER
jgi:hypothetical protein